MEREAPEADDLDVRLRWPGSENTPPNRQEAAGEPHPEAHPQQGSSDGDAVARVTPGPAPDDDFHEGLTSIGVRLEGLTARLERTVAAVLSEVARSASAIEGRISDVESAIGELKSQRAAITDLAPISRVLDDVRADIRELLNRETPEPDLTPLAEKLEGLSRGWGPDLEPLESALVDLREELTETLAERNPATVEQDFPAEQVLDAIEELTAQLQSRFDRLESAPSTEDATAEILERLEVMSNQMDVLRRRMALRARADRGLEPAAIEAIADAVEERLRGRQPGDAPPAGRRRLR